MSALRYARVAALVFGVVALLHAVRAVAGWEVRVGGGELPVWLSWVVALLAGSLCVAGLRARR